MGLWKRVNYLEDYVTTLNAKGKKRLVYQGDLFQCTADDTAWRRYRRIVLVEALLALILCAVASLVDPSSLRITGAYYVLFPYAALFLATVFGGARSVHLQFLRREIERMDYDKCIISLRRWTLATVVLGAAAGIAQIVYIFLQQAFAFQEWATAILCLFAGGLAWCSRCIQARYPYENIGKAPPVS